MKKKSVAGILALLFGILGVHRFYLGQRFKGFLMIALFGIMMIATLEENAPFIILPAIIGFIDAILFFVMPKEDFDDKFNTQKRHFPAVAREDRRRPANYRKASKGKPIYQNTKTRASNPYKTSGIAKFKEYEYEGAIKDFEQSLKIKPDDPAVHWNLACAYSATEKLEAAFFHLDKAVQFGFDDFDRIQNHDALAYMRTSDDFPAFQANNYRVPARLEAPKADLLSTPPTLNKPIALMDADFLEKIAKLGELRDKGVLTEEEFSLQKKRLLELR